MAIDRQTSTLLFDILLAHTSREKRVGSTGYPETAVKIPPVQYNLVVPLASATSYLLIIFSLSHSLVVNLQVKASNL